MRGTGRSTHARRWLAGVSALLVVGSLLVIPISASAAEPSDMVLTWNEGAISVISSPNAATPPGLGQPPPISAIHLAMVQGAVYDAVTSIDRSHDHYLAGLPNAPATASKAAAVAQAAHDVLIGITPASLPAVKTRIDDLLTASLATIPASASKDAGITSGKNAAAAMLTARANDGRTGTAAWVVGTGLYEWRPVGPANANVFGWAGDVTPFLLKTSGQYRVDAPPALDSAEYAKDFNEVKAKGRATGSTRTAGEESLASFVSANPVPYMNKGLRDVAIAKGLRTSDQARFFAQASMAAADALIGCFDNKAYWNSWRPTTAIHEAATDGNPATTADPDWTALYGVPGYPDQPSGYNCYSAGLMHSARLFFGTDKVSFKLTSPGTAPLPGSTRSYDRFTGVVDDTIKGRILIGFHFRFADVDGAWLGKKVAQYADKHYFGAVADD